METPRSAPIGRHLSVLATLIALVCGVFVGLAPAASAAPAVTSVVNGVRLNGVEAALLKRINSVRAARRLPTLTVAPGYTDVARRWSAAQAKRRVLAHNPNARVQLVAAGGAGWRALGENVGFGMNADSLFKAYWNSSSHRANMLNPAYRYIGIGWVSLPNGTGYNTQNFVSSYSRTYGPSRVRAV